ncbi:MAG TPA: DUF3634 family protein [Polyangiaceae bacterium]
MTPADLVLVAAALVATCAWLLFRRATELCAVRVTNGVTELVRGRAPVRFLSDVADIVGRARLDGVAIRVIIEAASPRLVVAGGHVPDAVTQQLRNAAGQHTLSQFRQGRPRHRYQ